MLVTLIYVMIFLLTLPCIPDKYVPLFLLLSFVGLLIYNRKSFYTGSPPVKGIGYQFYNNKSDDLHADVACDENWNATRKNDLKLLNQSGVECLRLYEWSWARNHGQFLSDLETNNLKTCIPVSMYNLLNPSVFTSDTWKSYLNKEFLSGSQYRPSIKYIMVGNEPELTALGPNWPKVVCDTIQKILDAEKSVGVSGPMPMITVPVSFGDNGQGPGVGYLNMIESEMSSRGMDLGDRYIGSINVFSPPDFIKSQFESKYQKPYIISEYAPPGVLLPLSDDRHTILSTQIKDAMNTLNIQGIFAFQYFDPTNKSGTERGFAFTCFESTYDVDNCESSSRCPPPDAKVGNRKMMLNGVADAYGGMLDNTLLDITCGAAPPTAQVCQPKSGADKQKVIDAIGYACGVLGDCSGNPCTNQPSPPYGAATWVFSKFYKEGKGSCDFGGIAEISSSPTYPSCAAE